MIIVLNDFLDNKSNSHWDRMIMNCFCVMTGGCDSDVQWQAVQCHWYRMMMKCDSEMTDCCCNFSPVNFYLINFIDCVIIVILTY